MRKVKAFHPRIPRNHERNKEPTIEWKKNFVKIDNECNLWDTGRSSRYSCIAQDKESVSEGPRPLRQLQKSLRVEEIVVVLLSNGKARMAAAAYKGKVTLMTFCIISWMKREADMHLWSSFPAAVHLLLLLFRLPVGWSFIIPGIPGSLCTCS